jgi:hypothetical protein
VTARPITTSFKSALQFFYINLGLESQVLGLASSGLGLGFYVAGLVNITDRWSNMVKLYHEKVYI